MGRQPQITPQLLAWLDRQPDSFAVSELAELLGVDPSTVYRRIRRAGIPTYQLWGYLRMKTSVARAWLVLGEPAPPADPNQLRLVSGD
jgi:excisionase family DNA binding protein